MFWDGIVIAWNNSGWSAVDMVIQYQVTCPSYFLGKTLHPSLPFQSSSTTQTLNAALLGNMVYSNLTLFLLFHLGAPLMTGALWHN